MADLAIRASHFDRSVPLDVVRELFRACVDYVEVEVFSYCNRTCWFCPNAKLDRRSQNVYMDERLYLRILADLGSIDYRGQVSYSRYNEPLSDRIILTRLRQARAALPHAVLQTNTNGDYLTRAYLDELHAAGLNQIDIQVYPGSHEPFTDDKILAQMQRRLEQLGLPFEFRVKTPGVRYMARLAYPGMEVQCNAWNFGAMGWDRGQTLTTVPRFQRTSPCWVVFTRMYVDHTGAVVPCCNIRSDEPSHGPYVVDSLADGKSLFTAYANSSLSDWRRGLLTFGPKQKPCNTCAYAVVPETAELRAQLDEISRALLGPASGPR
jgi:hypothetical protein